MSLERNFCLPTGGVECGDAGGGARAAGGSACRPGGRTACGRLPLQSSRGTPCTNPHRASLKGSHLLPGPWTSSKYYIQLVYKEVVYFFYEWS